MRRSNDQPAMYLHLMYLVILLDLDVLRWVHKEQHVIAADHDHAFIENFYLILII